jgi:hypothetical protein
MHGTTNPKPIVELRYKTDCQNPLMLKEEFNKGMALAGLLFNAALGKVIRDAAINIRGTIFYKSETCRNR